jgi:hypothetical protein
MLEIIFIWLLAARIGKLAERHGQKPLGFQLMLISLWFIGEILGGLVGAAISSELLVIYPIALLGAGLGAVLAFFLAPRLVRG